MEILDNYKTSDFDFILPEQLIAQTPLYPRDASRLMQVDRASGSVTHKQFPDLLDLLQAGDCLVLNNSKVVPARLLGHRQSGGLAEILLLRDVGNQTWECLTRPGRKTRVGATVSFGDGRLIGTVVGELEDGMRLVSFSCDGIFLEVLESLGEMPLPPYIHEKLADKSRYQTVYAAQSGSAAAPTAGLHFTPELLTQIEQRGVSVVFVTLHVGLGTFRPVKVDTIAEHSMHTEYYHIDAVTAQTIEQTKQNGGRVVAVGTTTCRTLESAWADGRLQTGERSTNIFMTPGYSFKVVDGLVTNFHLPQSTLIMLVSAFMGREQTLAAYALAIQERYRFFSFGDAMIIL